MANKQTEPNPDDAQKDNAPDAEDAAPEAEPKAAAKARHQPMSETVPGGRYIVDGRAVDANGKPLKD